MTAGRAIPQRSCIGCRQVHDRTELVRYVRAPDGHVLVDYRERLPGRGTYTCLDPGCIRQAASRRQFERAFRQACTPVTAEELTVGLREALHQRLAALLGMARKSSRVISGGNQVLDVLDRAGGVAAVILAGDVSTGVAAKVARKAAAAAVPCLVFASKSELGQLLGRGERSVIALVAGNLADTFLAEWQKYLKISGEV